MKLHLRKLPNGCFMPDDAPSVEAAAKVRTGEVLGGEFKRPRNYEFHKKWFSLVHYAFDMWEPGDDLPEKNFERFRKDITCLAGYYTETVNIRGEVRAEAKSLSFGSMDETEFSDLYEATVRVLLKWVFKNYTREDLDNVTRNILEYAA